jgi:pyruvate dehydrogenase E2 component (dihydrolipoamide acetyltransferase)
MAEIITMPMLGFDMAEGTLIRWMKLEGEPIAKGDILAEIETDKATVEVEAQTDGVMRKHLIQEGTSVPVGRVIAVIGDEDEEIDYERLLKIESLEEALEIIAPEESAPPLTPERLTPKAMPEIFEPKAPSVQTVKTRLSKHRSVIGKRMTYTKQNVPHFYLTGEYDAAPLTDLRNELNEQLPEGEKISVNDFIVKAAALALREFPNLNASLQGDEIHRYSEINIGIAVAIEDGLLTVVIRNADQKSLRSISHSARTAISRARDGRVRAEDVEGSTFTISNLGMFDIENFIAIIDPPEAAILAIGTIMDVPIVKAGEIVPGKRFKATLSVDHRVTVGAEAAMWLQVFKKKIEDPSKLLLE